MNKYDYNKLTPFKWFILENFPLIDEDFDALTNWQLFCKLGKEINKIINSQNNVGQQMENVTNAFIVLQNYVENYFNNLDVQDEINNKLDSLVEDGTLTTLIGNYVDPKLDTFENEITTRQNTFEANTTNNINNFETTINDTVNSQNAQISTINAKVNASVGLVPLVADTVEEMTDTTKIYVLSTSGYWYYYDGTDWVAGGIYQATSYGENTIPSKSIENVVYNKVNNNINAETFTTSNFTNLSNMTITENTNDFTFRVTSRSSNASFRLTLTPAELNSNLHLAVTFSNLRCIPALNITTSNNKAINGVCTLKNGLSYINLDAEDVKATTSIQFTIYANHYNGIADGDIFITIAKDYATSTSNFYDFSNTNNLSDILNNLTKYKGITNRYNYKEFTHSYGNNANISSVVRTNNNYAVTLSTANAGIQTVFFNETGSKLHIKGSTTVDSTPIRLYFLTRESNNTEHYNSWVFNANSTIDLTLDLAFYSVYQNMATWKLIINGESTGTFKINNLQVYVDEIGDLEIYADNLEDTLIKIQNKFSSIDSTIAGGQELTAPNGTKYKLVVDNDGELSTVSASNIPTKALFIGNSLLNGFGNHGMASYSVNDDYYYYVTQYLLTLNENFTSSKLAGGDWEGATTQAQVNTFINNYLVNAMDNTTDTVFIQLGDNCNTTEKVEFIPTKFAMLISAIRSINPYVTIYWVASWYNSTAKQNLLTNACATYGIKYINIAPLNTSTNQAYIGYEYLDSSGNLQTISNSGVASHPSSVGMQKIANLIIENI